MNGIHLRRINKPLGTIANPATCEDHDAHAALLVINERWRRYGALIVGCNDIIGVLINTVLTALQNPRETTSKCLLQHLKVHQPSATVSSGYDQGFVDGLTAYAQRFHEVCLRCCWP